MLKIGIVGGAGPMAGAALYTTIIRNLQKTYKCKEDGDFPEIILVSYPFSKMIEEGSSNVNKNKIKQELQTAIDTLSRARADIVAIACNTLHYFTDSINWNGMQPINIIDVTVEYAIARKPKSVLILGTPTTVASKLYEKKGINAVYPTKEQQEAVTKIIQNILSGSITKQDSNYISNISSSSESEYTILGCTELSVLFNSYPFAGNIIDPINHQAIKCIETSIKKTALV